MTHSKALKTEKEDVIDNIINKYFCKAVSPWFSALNHTPNMISLYGTCFTIAFLYYLWHDDMVRFTIYFWIAYFFDCLDGYYARKYNMVSSFGDVFEHVRDVLAICFMLFIWFINYTLLKEIYILFFVTSLFTGVHIGCQQILYKNREHDESLDALKLFCITDEILEYYHYFGVGCYMFTLNLITIFLSKGIIYMMRWIMMLVSIFMLIGYGMEQIQQKGQKEQRQEIIVVPSKILRK